MYSFFYKKALSLHRGLSRAKSAGVPVISVGNITVGGTGKTPFVMKIMGDIGGKVKKAVVSRGYGRKGSKPFEVESGDDYVKSGDEPLMIKRRFPDSVVIVNKNRYRGAREAADKGCRVVILDDGFQSWEIKKDLNIVLVDAVNPFGSGKLFPFGSLREPENSLSRADIVVVTRCNRTDGGSFDKIKEKIQSFAPRAQILSAGEKLSKFVSVFNSQKRDAGFLSGKRLMCFSAIGRNSAFHRMLEEKKAVIVEKREKRDHHRWKENEIKKFVSEAAQKNLRLVTTEKDAIKLSSFEPFECWYPQIEIAVSGEEILRNKINKILNEI
ncbi:MAG: tetraacyldisaccharide 4'-kinase [Elusimicrobiota bacterium]